MNLCIAQVRTYPEKCDLDANFCALTSILAEIAPHKPDIVITPEGFLDGYVSTEDHVTRENLSQYAIDPDHSQYVDAVAEWAAAHESWFILGCIRQAPEGFYNTALILNRSGDLVGMYDKTHLQNHDLKYVPGKALPVFESDFGAFGVLICADRRWPETVRTLSLRGAPIIFNPTYGMHDERNLHMMQTRSYESEVFIVFTHPGQSLITGPRGEIVVNDTREDVRYAVTDIDLGEAVAVRDRPTSHLRDRHPDLYER